MHTYISTLSHWRIMHGYLVHESCALLVLRVLKQHPGNEASRPVWSHKGQFAVKPKIIIK